MRAFEVKEQPRMGLKQLFDLTLVGIKYRLFRSFMTMLVITVAIAFLMNMLSGSLIQRSALDEVDARIDELRLALSWQTRLSQRVTGEQVIEDVAGAPETAVAFREAMTFGQLDADATRALAQKAAVAQTYLGFFERLDFSPRFALLQSRELSPRIFDRLQDPGEWSAFVTRLEGLRSVRFITELSAFEAFLAQWPALKATVSVIAEQRNAAIETLRPSLQNPTVMQAFEDLGGPLGDEIRSAGFALDETLAEAIATQAHKLAVANRTEGALSTGMRRELAGRMDVEPTEIDSNTLWRFLRDGDDAEWFVETYRAIRPEAQLTPEDLVAVARHKGEEQRLGQIEQSSAGLGGGSGFLGLGERLGWLLIVSLVVCVVGIANAMLMSVTERYREIATLKCLGALDRSILWIFVMEASLLGLVGGLIGSFVGMLIALGRMAAGYGDIAFLSLPLLGLLGSLLGSIILGMLLAAVASVYPSLKAARLAPMEAMRIE
ncbi:MAG: ABC transporter permease [Opitutales bacterium]